MVNALYCFLCTVGRKRKEEGKLDSKPCQWNTGVISIKQFIFHALELFFQENSSYLSGCSQVPLPWGSSPLTLRNETVHILQPDLISPPESIQLRELPGGWLCRLQRNHSCGANGLKLSPRDQDKAHCNLRTFRDEKGSSPQNAELTQWVQLT